MSPKIKPETSTPEMEAQIAREAQEINRTAIRQVLDFVEDFKMKHGDAAAVDLNLCMVSSLISSTVFNQMLNVAERTAHLSAANHEGAVWSFYTDLKEALAEAVATGLEHGVNTFSPSKYPEYECKIELLSVTQGRVLDN